MNSKTIGEVSRETGTHPSSLRRWEQLGLIVPARLNVGGRSLRMYSEAQVDLLRKVSELLNMGFSLRGAFEWAVEVPDNNDREADSSHGDEFLSR